MSKKETRQAKLWSVDEDAEYLSHETAIDAVQAYLDEELDGEEEEFPESVMVYGWAPRKVEVSGSERILEDFLEELDEEYGNPDESTKPTPAMRQALHQFQQAVIAEYPVYMCEEVTKVEVKVSDVYAPRKSKIRGYIIGETVQNKFTGSRWRVTGFAASFYKLQGITTDNRFSEKQNVVHESLLKLFYYRTNRVSLARLTRKTDE